MDRKVLLFLVVATLPQASIQVLPTRPCNGAGYRGEPVLVVSEISENAVLAAGGVDSSFPTSVRYQQFTTQFSNFFTDVRSAESLPSSGSIQSGMAYFYRDNTVGISQFSWQSPQWTSATSFAGGVLPARPAAAGAAILQGLEQIVQRSVQIKGSRASVHVPIVYASSMRRSQVGQIAGIINNLRAQGILVQLFAVGQAAGDSNIERLRPLLNDNNIIYVAPSDVNIAGLGQAMTDRLLTCKIAVVQDACKNCYITDGVDVIAHQTRCDKFIKCYILNGEIVSKEEQCPHGTLFDDSKHVCEHDYIVLNGDRTKNACKWCQTENQQHPYQDSCAGYLQCTGTTDIRLQARCCPSGQTFVDSRCVPVTAANTCSTTERALRHAHGDYCRTFYQCTGETLNTDCCPQGQGYNETTRVCEDMPQCANVGCFASATPVCETVAVAGSNCQFRKTGGSYPAQTCAIGTRYSQSACDCVHDRTNQYNCGVSPARSLGNCDPDVNITMTGNQNIRWGFQEPSYKWINVNGNPGFSPGLAHLDGVDDYLQVPHYSSFRGFIYNEVFFRVNVKDDWFNDPTFGLRPRSGEFVVLSNSPCPDGVADSIDESSILITLFPESRTARFRVRTQDANGQDYVAEVNVTYDDTVARENTWKELTLRYRQEPGRLEGHVRTYTRDANGFRTPLDSFRGVDDTNIGGQILNSECGIKIGKGAEGLQSMFPGDVTDIYFYDTCGLNRDTGRGANLSPPSVDSLFP